VRIQLHAWLGRIWQRRGLCAHLLLPLAALHRLIRAIAVVSYRIGLRHARRVGVPVVVVGNLYAGGTGKTPTLIEIVRALRQRGWRPAVVSRGYGSGVREARLVTSGSTAAECGDEAVLIAAATGVPVAVGIDRVAAAQLIRNAHPSCNVLVSDDGLQHRPLARDIEIAVIHQRGLGNGWLLPAGPLRDPPKRLQDVDAVVFNGQIQPVRIFSPFFKLTTSLQEAFCLSKPASRTALADLAKAQAAGRMRLLAACGIGTPERFFEMLAEHGLKFDSLALPDHFSFQHNPFPSDGVERILITEKDAVKCRTDRVLSRDARLWVVPLRASLDLRLIDLIEARLRQSEGKAEDTAEEGAENRAEHGTSPTA
jgi:tetraacyldisaccharide 4'-kinase